MRFFVTYCVMDGEIANPLGHHACLILSYQHANEKIQVANVWGFYPDRHVELDLKNWVDWIKSKIKLSFNFHGNHGELKEEEVRFLDLGSALHGMSFEISSEQSLKLKKICHEMMVNQEQAIKEWTAVLSRLGKPPTHAEIFAAEKADAQAHNRPSRLYPFDFHLGLDLRREGVSLTMNSSHTCKTMDLFLLRQIGIPEEQLDFITNNGTSTAIPRFSGDLEKIYLHSEGPLHQHASERTGNVSFFKMWKDKATKVFWSLPPQRLFSAKPNDPLKLDEEKVHYLKKYLSQIQKLEHVFLDSQLEAVDEKYRQPLIDRIHKLYNVLGKLKNTDVKIDEKIEEARLFLNSIYSAINDNWQNMVDVESVAAKYSLAVQQKICNILERPMVKDLSPIQSALYRM